MARETAGCVELANRDGSGGGVRDDVDGRSTRPPALWSARMVQWQTEQRRGRQRQRQLGAKKRKDTVARVQPPRRMPRCSAACDAEVSGGSCQCHRGPPWECRVRSDFAPNTGRQRTVPRREEEVVTGPWTKTRTLPESRRAFVQYASWERSGVASPVGVTGLRGVDPKANGCMR